MVVAHLPHRLFMLMSSERCRGVACCFSRRGLALCLCDVQIPPDLAIASAPELRVLGASGATARTATEVLTPLGVFASGSGEGGSEIVAVDPASDQMFITNGTANAVDIVNTADPNSPVKVASVDASSWGNGIQSVAVGDGIFAVAVKAAVASANGTVATFTTSGVFVASYEAGNLPDPEAIANWKVLGMYVPDAIAAVAIDGTDSLVSANEGDAGDDDCYSDEERVKVFTLAS